MYQNLENRVNRHYYGGVKVPQELRDGLPGGGRTSVFLFRARAWLGPSEGDGRGHSEGEVVVEGRDGVHESGVARAPPRHCCLVAVPCANRRWPLVDGRQAPCPPTMTGLRCKPPGCPSGTRPCGCMTCWASLWGFARTSPWQTTRTTSCCGEERICTKVRDPTHTHIHTHPHSPPPPNPNPSWLTSPRGRGIVGPSPHPLPPILHMTSASPTYLTCAEYWLFFAWRSPAYVCLDAFVYHNKGTSRAVKALRPRHCPPACAPPLGQRVWM
jgi:hypothetical protein